MARRAAGDTGLTTFYLADLHFGAAFASGVRAEQVRTEIVDVVSPPRGGSGAYWPTEDAIGDTREGEPLSAVILHWGNVS